jgi:transcription initiation factor TFIIIB Brf1 subunit/transcription initiation factor TFIIB
MQSLDYGSRCPDCLAEMVDVGDEFVCPVCGVVGEKEVLEFRGLGNPVTSDFTGQSLGSYLGSAEVTLRERRSKGFSKANSSYRYLKALSDFGGREDGPLYSCAKMIERTSERLSLPKIVGRQAITIAKKVLRSAKRDRRVTLAAVSAYSIIASCKIEGVTSVSVREIVQAHAELGRRVKASSIIQLSLDSPIKTSARRPEEYLTRTLAKLSSSEKLVRELQAEGVSRTVYFNSLRETAGEILALVGRDSMDGHRPCALAATAIYSAERVLANREFRSGRMTQRDLATCGDTAEYTIREQYREMFMGAVEKMRSPSLQNQPLPVRS